MLPWTPWPGRTGITVSNCTPSDEHALKDWFVAEAQALQAGATLALLTDPDVQGIAAGP